MEILAAASLYGIFKVEAVERAERVPSAESWTPPTTGPLVGRFWAILKAGNTSKPTMATERKRATSFIDNLLL